MILAITYMLIVSKIQALTLSSVLKFRLTYLDISTSMYLSFSKLNMSKEFSTLSTILSSLELPISLNGNNTQHSHPRRCYGYNAGPFRSNQATNQISHIFVLVFVRSPFLPLLLWFRHLLPGLFL